jgi:glutathione synthase/RimK-type ligase-like ATP-grasp enzyme
MILIITHKQDFTADYVINKLNEKRIEYFRLNCEDIDSEPYVMLSQNNFSFSIHDTISFNSVWFRRTKLPDLNIKNEAEKIYLLNDYDSLFENIYHLIDAKKWLSHPQYVYAAENKLYQLRSAVSIGFNIPDTITTNNHNILKDFVKKYKQGVIIKPLRQGRIREVNGFKTIFTNKINEEIIQNLNDYDLTPSIIQEYIEKEYELRITIVGDKVFSAKINSQKYPNTKIDWRKEKFPFENYSLPAEVKERCVALTKKLKLSFGAIDLIKNKEGEYIFLEINPNGQWAWLDIDLGLNISDEIINFLTS